ncbi:unnamed protein product [Leptosia nina]|uniref:Uncharacterized protein n=1 Tax=Leptosia nina TaxID=320188 RepID=A0AAV1IYU4_9NEOP
MRNASLAGTCSSQVVRGLTPLFSLAYSEKFPAPAPSGVQQIGFHISDIQAPVTGATRGQMNQVDAYVFLDFVLSLTSLYTIRMNEE